MKSFYFIAVYAEITERMKEAEKSQKRLQISKITKNKRGWLKTEVQHHYSYSKLSSFWDKSCGVLSCKAIRLESILVFWDKKERADTAEGFSFLSFVLDLGFNTKRAESDK